jgi:hypothetical protein
VSGWWEKSRIPKRARGEELEERKRMGHPLSLYNPTYSVHIKIKTVIAFRTSYASIIPPHSLSLSLFLIPTSQEANARESRQSHDCHGGKNNIADMKRLVYQSLLYVPVHEKTTRHYVENSVG